MYGVKTSFLVRMLKFVLSLAVFFQMPAAWSAVKGPRFGYNNNYKKLHMSNRDRYQQSQFSQQQNRRAEQANRAPKKAQVRQIIINGKPLTNDSPLWMQGGAKPVTDRPFTQRTMKLQSLQIPGTKQRIHTAFKDVMGPDGKIYRRYADSSGQWRDVELPQGAKPSELRQEIQSYRKAGPMIAKRFALDTLGFYFAGNAVQGTLHRLGGMQMDEGFDRKVDEMVTYVEANPDDAMAQMLGHTFASEIFQNWALLGDPLALEYLNKLKPVLDPRFIQTEFEMSFTQPKGAMHFASFIGINTLYGIWINNQYIKATNYVKANSPRFMSQRTLNGMFNIFRNNYFSMMVASVGASVVTDTFFLAYDCSIAKIMNLDPNNVEDKIKLEKCDEAWFEYKTSKIYERWFTTAAYQLIPAAYFSANLQKGIAFAYNVGRDVFAKPKPMAPPSKINITGQFRRGVRATRAGVAGAAQKAAQSANVLLNAADDRIVERVSNIKSTPIQRVVVSGFYSVKGIAGPVASIVRVPFTAAAVAGKVVDGAVNNLKWLSRAHPAMTFALITVPHFYNFLFWNEIFMPAYKMGMAESHAAFADGEEEEIRQEIALAQRHGFDPSSMVKRKAPGTRGFINTKSEAFYRERLTNRIHDYGKFQTQYRNFLLEDGNMAISNWKMALMELDQRLVGSETVYKDFLTKLEEKEKFPEIFDKKNEKLEFFTQVKPLEAEAEADDSGRFSVVYKVKDLEGMSEQDINKARMDTVMIARQLLVDTKVQLLPMIAKRSDGILNRLRTGLADMAASFGMDGYEYFDSADPALITLVNEIDEYLQLFKDYNPQRDGIDTSNGEAVQRYWWRLHLEWEKGIRKLAQSVRADQRMNDLCQEQALGGLYCLFQYTYERLGAPTFRGQDYFDSLALHLYSTKQASDESNEKNVGNLRTRHYGEYMLGQMACGPDPFAEDGNMVWYNTQTEEVREMKESLAQCKSLITEQVGFCRAGDYKKAGQQICNRYAEAREESALLPLELRPYGQYCRTHSSQLRPTIEKYELAGQARCDLLLNTRVDEDRFGGTYFDNWMQSSNEYMQGLATWSYEFFGDFPECTDYVVNKSSFIRAVSGLSFGFDPPSLVKKQNICNQGYGMANTDVAKETTGSAAVFSENNYSRLMNPFNGEWIVNGKAYRNFVDVVAENLEQHAFDYEDSRSDFDIFWNNHVKPYTDRLFQHAHDQYLNVVEYSVKPSLYGRLHYRTGNLFPPLADLRRIVEEAGWFSRHIRHDEVGTVSSLRIEIDFYFNSVLPQLLNGAVTVESVQRRRAYEKLRTEKVGQFIDEFKQSFLEEGMSLTDQAQEILMAFLTDDPAFEQMSQDMSPEMSMMLVGMQIAYPEYIQAEMDKFDHTSISVSDLDLEQQRDKVRAYLQEMHQRFEAGIEKTAKFEDSTDREAFKQNSYELLILLQKLMNDLGQSELSAQLGQQLNNMLTIEPNLSDEVSGQLQAEIESEIERAESPPVLAAAPLEGQDKFLESVRAEDSNADSNRVTQLDPENIVLENPLPEIWLNEMQEMALKQTLENKLNGLSEFSGYISLIEDLNYSDRLGIQ
jgi:hypothetical protein